MLTVLQTFPIPAGPHERLRAEFHVREAFFAEDEPLRVAVRGCAGVLAGTERWPRATIAAAAPLLQAISRFGTGTDSIDLAAATELGVAVLNTPGANAQTMAEFAVGLMWALSRQLTTADRAIRTSGFEQRTHLRGFELAGKTAGIVGFGQTGSRVAHICQHGFGMRVLVNTAHPDPVRLTANGIDGRFVALPELLTQADYITLHVPVTETTRQLIGRRELALMKPAAMLVNISRGWLVDSQAVAQALQAGTLAGYAADVFEVEPPPPDHPLLRAPNTILSPHYGGHTEEGLKNMGEAAVSNLIERLRGGRPANTVNPAVYGNA